MCAFAQFSIITWGFSSGVCNAQAGGTVQNVAQLQQGSKSGKWTNFGDFYLTFNFNVTNP